MSSVPLSQGGKNNYHHSSMRLNPGEQLGIVQEEVSNPFGDQMFSMMQFQSILSLWWKETDLNRGNLALSAEKIAQHFVRKEVSNEVESVRRSLLLQVYKLKKGENVILNTYPACGEDFITIEDYNMVFCKGIFRELLTQLASKLKDAM